MFKDPLTLPHLTGITGKFTLYPSPTFPKLVKHVLHERPISPINILFSVYVLLQDLTPSPRNFLERLHCPGNCLPVHQIGFEGIPAYQHELAILIFGNPTHGPNGIEP